MKTGKILILAVIVMSICFSTLSCAPKKAENEKFPVQDGEVWMSQWDIAEFEDISKWEYVCSNLDAISFFIDKVRAMDDERISILKKIQDNTNMKIIIECAGLCNWFVDRYKPGNFALASLSAKQEWEAVKKLTDAGIRVDYLDFDHPITRAMYPDEERSDTLEPEMSMREAAAQLAYAMTLWRQYLPELEFLYCSNFPNYAWKETPAYYYLYGSENGRGDMYEELQAAAEEAENVGIPFWGFVADNPYDYLRGRISSNQTEFQVKDIDWLARLLDFEKEVKARGMHFAVFFNSSESGDRGPDEKYYKETMEYINYYIEAGGNPDVFYIESWYNYPEKYLPETEKYTQTYITASVIRQIREGIRADLN